MMQLSFFGRGRPSVDEAMPGRMRTTLQDGAWVDHLSGWVKGHGEVFDHLRSTTRWQAHERPMYDRLVAVPRLMGRVPRDGPGHPVLTRIERVLTAQYGRPQWHVSLALYRDGRDSVAFHGDRMGERRWDTVVAVVSLGEPRRFLLRPAGGGASMAWNVGWGDLLVMGGSCQATYEHAIPKCRRAGPRMAVMFRPVSVPEV